MYDILQKESNYLYSNKRIVNTFFQECEIADRAIRSDLLSMERLLVHTIYVRTKSRLSDLKTELQTMLKDVECMWYLYLL